MSEQFGDIILRSHVLIVTHNHLPSLVSWAMLKGFTEFSVAKVEDKFQLAHPLAVDEREDYRWLYHKMKGLNNDPDKPTPPKGPPKGDGGGPTGGTPAAGQVAEYQDTIAVAA